MAGGPDAFQRTGPCPFNSLRRGESSASLLGHLFQDLLAAAGVGLSNNLTADQVGEEEEEERKAWGGEEAEDRTAPPATILMPENDSEKIYMKFLMR